MKKDKKYVPPIIECCVVAIESGFANSITDTSKIQEETRTEDTSDIEFYF